jgi:hypothetical protein
MDEYALPSISFFIPGFDNFCRALAETFSRVAIVLLIFAFLVLFCIAWFVIYTTLGSWLKVRLIHIRLAPSAGIPRRYGPVILSHILYSILFVNPVTLDYVARWLDTEANINGFQWLSVVILYFWLLPVGTDCLCFSLLRLLPSWSALKRLKYRPPLKRLTLANLAVSSLGFVLIFGTAAVWIFS